VPESERVQGGMHGLGAGGGFSGQDEHSMLEKLDNKMSDQNDYVVLQGIGDR
jgi:hypothetical protein